MSETKIKVTFEEAKAYCLSREAEDEAKGGHAEYMVIYAPDGTQHFRSNAAGATAPMVLDDILEPGDTLVHNHPKPCYSLTEEDCFLANAAGCIVTAVCSDGGIYSVDFTKKRYPEPIIKRAYPIAGLQCCAALEHAARAGLPEADVDQLHEFLILEHLCSAGFAEFKYTLGANMNAALMRMDALCGGVIRQTLTDNAPKDKFSQG